MFGAGAWPLHVTIVPPFSTELGAEAVAALLPRVPAIRVVGGTRARFGRRRDVPVTLLRDSPALRALHLAAVDALEAAGATIGDRHHIRAAYRPHATDQPAGSFAPGARATLRELALVERTPDSTRTVAARVPLS